MTTYTWPDTRTFQPQTSALMVVDGTQRSHDSGLSGYTQTQSMPGARWGWTYDMPAQNSADRQALEAWLLRLNGREHRARLWDHKRATPRGNLATSGVVLAEAAAQFASVLRLQNCRPRNNLLLNAGFEIDTNGDGVADGWSEYTAGTTGSVSAALSASPLIGGAAGEWKQYMQASALAGRLGVSTFVDGITPGQIYTWSVDANCSAWASVALAINWVTESGAFISEAALSFSYILARRSISSQAPAGAARALLYVWVESTSGAATGMNFDNAQFEPSASPTPHTGPATISAGDWLGMATGQLVRAVEDATADDAGDMTVQVRHMLRQAASSGSAVVLDKPTALYVRTEAGLTMPRQPGHTEPPISIEWVEVFA